MDIEELRLFCLSFPTAEESFPFGPETLVFKSGAKIFVLLSLDANPYTFNVKCDPEKAIELRDQYACVLPGYHMNKKHWNTIVVDGSIPAAMLKQFVTDSYYLVTPQRKKV